MSICRPGTGVVGPAADAHVILENDDGRPAALVSDRASGGSTASARKLAVAELAAYLVLALTDQLHDGRPPGGAGGYGQ